MLTEFSKTKITFALALVGVLFAIHPIVKEASNFNFLIFDFKVTVMQGYYSFALLLALSVYTYALDFLTHKPLTLIQKTGNVLYALSLLTPPLFLALWLLSKITLLVAILFQSDKVTNIAQMILSVFVGVLLPIAVQKIKELLNSRDRESSIEALSSQEISFLSRAKEMLNSKHYDLAVVEAFRAFEATLHRVLLNHHLPIPMGSPMQVINFAFEEGILPQKFKEKANNIRMARNKSAHGAHEFTPEEASKYLDISEELIFFLIAPNASEG